MVGCCKITLTVCWVKNMNGLLVAYVGTWPLRVMKGSSLMVRDGPSVCAVVEIGKIPPERGCVPAWLVCGGTVAFGGHSSECKAASLRFAVRRQLSMIVVRRRLSMIVENGFYWPAS